MEIDDQKSNIASTTKSMAVQKEELEKDSGMEESMGTSPHSETQLQQEGSASNSDDDDEDFCVRSHQRGSRVIDDDDDDDDNDDDNIVNIEPVLEAAADDDDDVPLVLDKDESDGEDSLFIIKRKKKTSQNASQNLLEDTEILPTKELTLDADIFDANGSDSETDAPFKDRNSFGDQSDEKGTDEECEDDEGIDTEGLSQKLKALLKKGAKKKQKSRASKTLAEEKLQLHSETQRLIRESKVQIPYHQPESKSLDDFLNRALRKQQQYRALKINSQNERKKVEFVQDTITNDNILFKRVSLESATCNSQENSSQIKEDTAVNNPITQSLSQAPKHSDPINSDAIIITEDSEASLEVLLTEKSSLAPETKEPEINLENEGKDDNDEELPDLIISEEPSREEDLTGNVVEPELFETIPNRELVKDAKKCDSEEVTEVADSSTWVIDENGLLKTDDPLMDELITADYKANTEQANEKSALADVTVPEMGNNEEKKEAGKENPLTKPKLSISQLLTPEMKNIKPKLSGNWDQPIVFDDDPTEKVKNTGLDNLMQRLLKHSNVQKEQKENKKVNIKIIQKEQTDGNKQELCLNTITYQTDEPEHLKLKSDKPGVKLLLLKDKLQQQMRVKRESARQKRCEIFNLNNEDGFEDQLEENEEEEEAELTDGSDTDVSEEDLIENDLGEDYGKEKRTHNAFVDEEAEEEEEEEEEQNRDDEDEEHEEDAEDEDDVQSKEKREEREEILFDSHGDSDSDSIIPESQNRPRIKKLIRNLILSDDESQNASIPYQDENEKDAFQKTDFLGTFSSNTNDNELKTPSAKPFIQPLMMPAEDSQDLYKSSIDFQSPDLNSQNLRFPLESQASPILDEQGFLRVKTLTKIVNQPKISALGELCDNDDNADDLLGLCSGKFSGSQDDRMKSCRTLFTDSQSNSQFPASGSFPFSSKVKYDERKATDEEETEDFPSLKLISDDEEEADKKEEDDDENSENDEDDGTEEEGRSEDDDDDDDDDNNNKVFPKFRLKSSGKIRREFVDDEAELSGSEFDSDENDNLNEEYDVMDEEEGDQDVNLTEDQLRNQVGRVHLKNMIDEDKREVMRLQEMYLPDGDLFSEGHGRTRRFRWKNLDDNSQQDMFNTESETEEKEEEEPDELKWRIERFEREKWINEQEVQEKKHEEESSFFKFGRNFLKKKGTSGQNGSKKLPLNDTGSPKQSKLNVFKNFKKGSFLSRSSDSLAKIAEMTKPLSNGPVTNISNGRNFVFSVVTPTETETPTTGPQKKKAESKSCPPAKKRKIEPVKRTLSETSVFRHIDKSFT